MRLSNRLSLLVGALVLALGLVFYFYFRQNFWVFGGGLTAPEEREETAHFYKNPKVNIGNIVLKVFYVVPKNLKDRADPGLETVIRNTLDRAVQFHELQFRGLSNLKYYIFPEPVILKEDNRFYDTVNTSKGNPEGLLRISQEINDRVFVEGGDLYKERFAKVGEREYPVMGLIYEGVGAAGSAIYESELNSAAEIARQLGIPESEVRIVNIKGIEGFFIVSREYLTKPEYSLNGATTLYHEFGHTMGLPDNYDTETNQPLRMDIMGRGREEPLELMYLDRSLLKDLGVL